MSSGYDGHVVVHDISFEVGPAQLVLIFGRNGTGKSTLFKSIVGLIKPFSGSILCNGQVITNASTREIVKLGLSYVPQGQKVFGSLTVRENLEVGSYTLTGRQARFAAIDKALQDFPALDGKLDIPARTLSGGQQQLLGFARALITGPRVVLLDEPSMGLDQARLAALVSLIAQRMVSGVAFVIIEQRPEIFYSLRPQRVFELQDGTLSMTTV